MPIGLPSYKPVAATLSTQRADTPTITNLVISSTGSEVSHGLQNNLFQVIIRARAGTLQVSFVSGESGSKFFTVPKGCSLTLDDLNFNSRTLYIQSDTVTVVEILELHT